MSKTFLFIKGGGIKNVRLSKYRTYLSSHGIPAEYWVWERLKAKNPDPDVHVLLSGGGFGGKRLFIGYLCWMAILFFKTLFSRRIGTYNIVAINFDAALPVALAACFRRVPYCYEIRDEFALSYRWPPAVKRMIQGIDHWLMRRAKLVIHVDANRVTYLHCNSIVIENTPFDHFKGGMREYSSIRHRFAVIGNLSPIRGMESIAEFARKHPEIGFLFVGVFYEGKVSHLFDGLSNVERMDYMPQEKLFSVMEDCCGIFSLYDPSLEINRLAASNKVYDAMMMGIPVITNPEVVNSSFIVDQGIGLTVHYGFDRTWDALANPGFPKQAGEMGRKGRSLYLEKYRFEVLFERLLKELEK